MVVPDICYHILTSLYLIGCYLLPSVKYKQARKKNVFFSLKLFIKLNLCFNKIFVNSKTSSAQLVGYYV